MYGWEGYKACMRAGVAVIGNSRTGDLNRFAVAGGTCVAQLWHGTPIRKIGWDVEAQGGEGAPFVYISTDEVYGSLPLENPEVRFTSEQIWIPTFRGSPSTTVGGSSPGS
mgnify:CR=1 FL=1